MAAIHDPALTEDVPAVRSQGLWWLPSAAEAAHLAPLPGTARALAGEGGPLGGGPLDGGGGTDLLAAAAGQRMSTAARRAVFCAVMGAADCADAAERLLRLPLKVPRQCANPKHLIQNFKIQLAEPTQNLNLEAARGGRAAHEHGGVVFCAVMGVADCADAAERLLRLPL